MYEILKDLLKWINKWQELVSSLQYTDGISFTY